MPEGPEIKQEADRLGKVLCGSKLVSITIAFEHLKHYEADFLGRTVSNVESRGKALLTHIDTGDTIYSHNQLYGKWFLTKPGEPPETGRSLRLALRTSSADALLYSASEIDVWKTSDVYTHPYISRLGPEVLKSGLRLSAVTKQLHNRSFTGRQLGALLLDQSFIAGIGNYLRSDILNKVGLHPSLRPSDLTETQKTDLAKALRDVTRQSYRTKGITNDLKRVRRLKASGVERDDYRHLAFRRDGEDCYTCGAPIERIEFSSRRLYLCPTCQPPPT